MFSALLAGTIFGLSAGLTPGPLLALVIAQTLKHDTGEGIKVAIAPVLTDIPIILLAFFVLLKLSNVGSAIGLISIVGSFYVLYLAYETIKAAPVEMEPSTQQPGSIRKGILVNALNPHPYLFWATVGVPFMLKLWRINPIAPWLFGLAFYIFLIGSKVLLVVFIGRFKTLIQGKAYCYLLRSLGVILIGFSVFLFRDALVHFGMLP